MTRLRAILNLIRLALAQVVLFFKRLPRRVFNFFWRLPRRTYDFFRLLPGRTWRFLKWLASRRPRHVVNFLYQYPTLAFFILLLPPLLWLLVIYIAPLFDLLTQSRYTIDPFTMLVKEEISWSNYESLRDPANVDIIRRTVLMASAVTLASAILGFFPAYYMTRYAPPRIKSLLYLAVMLPVWSSYLVRVYIWRLILAKEGVIMWFVDQTNTNALMQQILDAPYIGGQSLSVSYLGLFTVFVYIWLPYMILPIMAALERVPKSLIEASSDLGARPFYTFRTVILPLAFPGVVAGSIFTFSLTLGDYIIPSIVGNSSFYIGSTVYAQQSFNVPLAATFTVVPLVIMLVYLMVARRLGAFDAL